MGTFRFPLGRSALLKSSFCGHLLPFEASRILAFIRALYLPSRDKRFVRRFPESTHTRLKAAFGANTQPRSIL